MRFITGVPHYLLVSAKKNPDLWVFPKGHIEKTEKPEDAALREIREEAGVEGVIQEHLEQMDYSSGNDMIKVDYYLVEYLKSVQPAEQREHRWCSYGEAIKLIPFQESRALLEKAHRIVKHRFS